MEPPPQEARDEPRKTLNPPVPPDREEISQNQILAKEERTAKIIGGPKWGYDGRKPFGKHRNKPNRWHPNFVASEAIETKSAIWIRLLELPTELYNQLILAKIGRKLGKLVKTDVRISEALRGRYGRICVEVPIGVAVTKNICIGHHNQPLVYEGFNILCSTCGVLGQINNLYPKYLTMKENNRGPTEKISSVDEITQTTEQTTQDGTWQIVSFTKKQNQHKRMEHGTTRLESKVDKSIHVNLFHADSSNLKFKIFKYKKIKSLR
ncbi:hypothetical protein H5410_056154 [Solanum commersonii]|uniref:DUF4283 domain-containing protein n=1 Tax=Solanum commersonii TaxID=4109 RepID=A0A9J5WLF9_SOLCO|nr:hypothetical protein H5410_056154 [Solanum commersonii]